MLTLLLTPLQIHSVTCNKFIGNC